ncbi:MAG: hypothetical protein JWO13_1603 [Acidobacteriales bacterium]|nr:hypothetical protein [Terriglobales bacterium]
MADKYWGQVAQLTGLAHCPNQGPFGLKDGAAIGSRNGYIVAIGPAKDGNKQSVKIMVRFPETSDGNLARMALENSNELAVALETDKVAAKQLKPASISTNSILWTWTYMLGKPKAEKLAAVANAIVNALKGTVPDFQGKCETCRNSSVSQVMLMNNLPGYFCSGCQFKAQEQQDSAAREYEAMESNLGLGLIYGAGAAFVGSLGWAAIALFLNRISLWAAFGIGFLVAWALIKGMGRITMMGQAAIALLTIASVLFGDVLFYTGYIVRNENVPFSGALLGRVLSIFWSVELKEGWLSIGFALIAAVYAVYQKGRKPKFNVVFTQLAPEGQANSATLS